MKEWFEILNYYDEFRNVETVFLGGNRDKLSKITVAIPAYRRVHLLRESIESVLRQQEFEEYEILVLDDCPEENPEMNKMMQEYIMKNDNIYYYRNKKNMGMGGCWNRCIELARTEWVVLLHDDDLLCENYLSVVWPIAERTRCSLLGTFSYQLNQLERVRGDISYSNKLEKSKKFLSVLRHGNAFELKKNDLLHFVQPSPGCWLINKKANIEFGGYDALRKKSGLIDGPFNFKNTYHGKSVIVPRFLFVRRIKENDFLNQEAQKEIMIGLYTYIRHYAETYTTNKRVNRYIVDISILNFARGMKAKYKSQINTKEILDEMGISCFLMKLPEKMIYLLNAVGLCKLIFRKAV